MPGPVHVTVFASSRKSNPLFINASRELGRLLAERKLVCVNGGGQFGCMGALNEGCKQHNGKITGVIHERFVIDFGESKLIDELVVSKGADLNERKQMLFDNGNCIIVLPGGIGTFDEFWDAVGAKSLDMKGMGSKPICLVNVDGFYDGFVSQIKRTQKEGLLYGSYEEYFHVENDVEKALDWCLSHIPTEDDDKRKLDSSSTPNGDRSVTNIDDESRLSKRSATSTFMINSWSPVGFCTGILVGSMLANICSTLSRAKS